MSDVFVSYAREDADFARLLRDQLVQQGRDVWVDLEDIPPSAEWLDEIHRGIEAAGAVVFVVSPDSLTSEICARELEYAGDLKKRIIPIVCRDPEEAHAPELIASRNWIFCLSEEQRASALQQLAEALDTDLAWVRLHTRLLVRALEWESHGGPRSSLLRGDDLSEAEVALAAHGDEEPTATPLQREYVLVSRRGATRRLQGSVSVALAALMVIASLGVVALIQKNRADERARIARSGQLATYALSVAGSDRPLSLLLATEAYDTAETPDAESALRAVIPSGRRGAVLRGHRSTVWSVAFSPDGSRLASASDDGTVRLWDWRHPAAEAVVLRAGHTRGPERGVGEIAFTPDGARLAIRSGDGKVRIRPFDDPDAVPVVLDVGIAELAFSPDGALLATASSDGVRLWDWQTADPQPLVLEGTNAVAFAPDGTAVATASDDAMRVWDLRDENAPPVVAHVSDVITTLAFSPDSARLVGAPPSDGAVWLWDWRSSGAQPAMMSSTGSSAVRFTPDGSQLASVLEDGTLHLWDWRNPQQEPTVVSLRGHRGAVTDFVFSSDGSRVATASYDGTVRLWDWRYEVPVVLRGHTDEITSVAFSPNGSRLASGSADAAVRVWDWRRPGGEPVVLRGHTDRVFSLTFSPDGSHLASESTDGTIRVWNWRRPQSPPVILGVPSGRFGMAFTPDGTEIVRASPSGSLEVDDWRHARRVFDFPGREVDKIASLEFSPDGSLLVAIVLSTTGGPGVLIWDWQRPTLPPLGMQQSVSSVAFTPDGTHLAVWESDAAVRVWDLRDPEARPTALHAPQLEDLRMGFNADGSRWIGVSRARDGWNVRLWDWRDADADPIDVPAPDLAWPRMVFDRNFAHVAGITDDNALLVRACDEFGPIERVVARAKRWLRAQFTTAQRRARLRKYGS